MTRALGYSLVALGNQRIVTVACMLALAACSNQTPVSPSTTRQALAGEAPQDLQDVDSQEAAPEDTDIEDAAEDINAPAAGTYSQYIALGDSYASGYGLLDALDKRTCARSEYAWPKLLYKSLKVPHPMVFRACSGATTQDISAMGPSVGGRKQTEPQLDGLPEDLDSALITVQIGGNDVKLSPAIEKCSQGLMGAPSSSGLGSITTLSQISPECASLDALLKDITQTVDEDLVIPLDYTFRQIRDAAPKARIVAVGYPHLVSTSRACLALPWSLAPIGYRKRLNDLADAINDKIKTAADNVGIESLTTEVVKAFEDREACTLLPMISSLNGHPNAAGHRAYARLLASSVPPGTIRTTDPTSPGDGTGDEPPAQGDGSDGSDEPGQ